MNKDSDTTPRRLNTCCCIAGGGPAGMMLGLLLARAGVEVIVLEKHIDFLRDFRGDTIHPSTLELMHELGLLDEFLVRPHQEVREVSAQIGTTEVAVADFTHLPTRCKFLAFMPQWDFLNFLAEQGSRYPTFHLIRQAEVTGLEIEGDRVVGVTAITPDASLAICADLVVGADGRTSVVREKAGLVVDDIGAPMDVLWMQLSRRPDDAHEVLGRVSAGHAFIMIDRGAYWQCALVIRKGGADELHSKGVESFRALVLQLAPSLGERVDEIASFDDVKLLTVAVNRVRQWYRPGLLCIGDAAHAMSPIGGVGINLAVQDAVAAANILAAPLRERRLSVDDLAAVQKRREFPTRATQAAQVFIQNNIISRVLAGDKTPTPPLPLRLLDRFAWLRRIPARLIGLGVRPEHIHTPDVVYPSQQ